MASRSRLSQTQNLGPAAGSIRRPRFMSAPQGLGSDKNPLVAGVLPPTGFPGPFRAVLPRCYPHCRASQPMTAQRITKRMVRCAQVQLQRVHHVG
jgi:hypothetical protein